MPHDDFIAEIHANPHDEIPRLVYADWLEDQGDPRAEYLRLECEIIGLKHGDALYDELHPRLQILRSTVSAGWLAQIGRSRVMNCDKPGCPKLWKRMKATTVGTIRICEACQHPVQYSKTPGEAAANSVRNQLVAIDKQYSDIQFDDALRDTRRYGEPY